MTAIGILVGMTLAGLFLIYTHWEDQNGPGTRQVWWLNAGSVLFIIGLIGTVGAIYDWGVR